MFTLFKEKEEIDFLWRIFLELISSEEIIIAKNFIDKIPSILQILLEDNTEINEIFEKAQEENGNSKVQENTSMEKTNPELFEDAYLNYFEKIKKLKSWRIQEKFIFTISKYFNKSTKSVCFSKNH